MNARTLKVLALVAVLLLAAVLLQHLNELRGSSSSGALLLPELKAHANDIRKVKVSGTEDNSAASILRKDAGWVIAERDDFPADTAKLRELILSLADAKAIERKTADPERHALLGVDDEGGRRVTLSGEGFEFAVILGHEAQSKYRYARVSDDLQSWLINANPEVPDELGDWLDNEVIDVAASAVRAVSIRHADGEELRIFKDAEDETNFQVADIPDGRELTYETVANGIGGVLDGLTLDDARNAEEVGGEALVATRFELFDGDEVVAEVFEIDDENWVAVARTGAENGETAEPAPWLYRLPNYKTNLLMRRWDDILKEEE